jgi:hypothetical protein
VGTSPSDKPFDPATICAGDEFAPLTLVRVVTASSVWLLLPDSSGGGKYLRMPRDEAPRPGVEAVGNRLDDGKWVEYEYAKWTSRGLYPGEFRLNIKPRIGPPDGYGVVTGKVCSISMSQRV